MFTQFYRKCLGVNVTFTGTVNGDEVNVSPIFLNIETMPRLLLEFIWRKKHHGHIWGGVIQCLREISFSSKSPRHTEF